MTPPPDIHTLTGVYALDALPDDERESFEAHLEVCDACSQEVTELRSTAALLAEPVCRAAPASLRENVLLAAEDTRQLPPRTTPAVESIASRRVPVWTRTLALSSAAALVLAVGGLSFAVTELSSRIDELEVQASQAEERTQAMSDVLAAPDAEVHTVAGDDGTVVNLVLSATQGRGVFVAEGMASAPPEHTYELWVIHENHAQPAGMFNPDAAERITHTVTGDLANAVAIGVTIEPEGGSPEPTTEPLMRIDL